jgi:hypothetical protein
LGAGHLKSGLLVFCQWSVVSIQWSVVDFIAANMKTRGYYFTMPGYSDDTQLQQLTTDNGQLTTDQ